MKKRIRYIEEDELKILINRLKKAIVKNQHTVKDAAKAIGISDLSIYALFLGGRVPRAQTIGKIEVYVKNALD